MPVADARLTIARSTVFGQVHRIDLAQNSIVDALITVARLEAERGVVDLRTPLEREEAEEPAFGPEALREEYPRPDREPEEVDEEIKLICHASPDAGWRLL